MTFSNIALEVGGVFLFVAGLMYLSLSGRLSNMFRDRAPKPLFLIALAVGFAIYHWGPMLYYGFSLPELTTPKRQATIPEPPPPPAPKPAPVKHRPMIKQAAASLPAQPEPEHWQTIIVQEVPATQVFVPPALEPVTVAPAAPPPDSHESKVKRAVKAVGRFLHLRKKEPRQP